MGDLGNVVGRPVGVIYDGTDASIIVIQAFIDKTFEETSAKHNKVFVKVTECEEGPEGQLLKPGDIVFTNNNGQVKVIKKYDKVVYEHIENRVKVFRKITGIDRYDSIQG